MFSIMRVSTEDLDTRILTGDLQNVSKDALDNLAGDDFSSFSACLICVCDLELKSSPNRWTESSLPPLGSG